MSEVLSPYRLLRDSVEEALASSSTQVRQRVVDTLVEKEVDRRTKLLLDGFVKLDDAKRALNKIRPDIIAYNEKGEKQTESWSKAKVEERKKAESLLKKIDDAIAAALHEKEPNYEKLSNLAKNGAEEEKKED